MLINVPVINESPNTITVDFQSDYAVSFEAANPDGVPANCQAGGPGVLGGPEYVNLLQRTTTSKTVPQFEYRYEQFQLAAYPNHTFYSFKNYTTGVKDVVAFKTNPDTTATIPDTAIASATITSNFTGTGQAGLTTGTASVLAQAGAGVLYTWGGTAVASIQTGQGTRAITFTFSTAGSKTLFCDVTDERGNVVRSNTVTQTIS